ncbi:MAG: transcription termination/antitermination protein NusG [Cyanobacteriota bacterium]
MMMVSESSLPILDEESSPDHVSGEDLSEGEFSPDTFLADLPAGESLALTSPVAEGIAGAEGTAGAEGAEKPQVARWYAVQVASSCEKKVKATLEQRAVTLGVDNRILEIEIPQTPGVKLKKDGTRQSIEEKVFPGYVLVRMILDEDTMMAVRSTPNVINFVGQEERRATGKARGHIKPRPLSRTEVERIFRRAAEKKAVVKVDLSEGDQILVTGGPFKDFQGEVIEVSAERSKLKALLSMFGRETPVELEFSQVSKQN